MILVDFNLADQRTANASLVGDRAHDMVRRDLLNSADIDHRAAIAAVRVRLALHENIVQAAVIARETQIKRGGGNHFEIVALLHQ